MLARDTLDLYQLHRADDPSTVVEDSVAELAALREEGKVRCVGLCNVTVAQLEKARAIPCPRGATGRGRVRQLTPHELDSLSAGGS